MFKRGPAAAVASVVWATGFQPHYPWLHVPVLDQRGAPLHHHGITAAPGLYFLGLHWQVLATSAMLGGVGCDAAMLAQRIAGDHHGKTWPV